MNLFEKIARRITRKSWNATFHHIIVQAMGMNVITSRQGHTLSGAWNETCFPEWDNPPSFITLRLQNAMKKPRCNCGASKAPAIFGVPHLEDCPANPTYVSMSTKQGKKIGKLVSRG